MALTLNADFTCSGTPETCVAGNGNADASFRYLQTVINRYYSVCGFSPIKINGKLDSAALNAAQLVGKWVISQVATPEVTSNTLIRNTAWATGLGNIAANSRELALLLDDIANQQRLPLTPPTKTNWILWSIAGVATFAVGCIVAIKTRKSDRI